VRVVERVVGTHEVLEVKSQGVTGFRLEVDGEHGVNEESIGFIVEIKGLQWFLSFLWFFIYIYFFHFLFDFFFFSLSCFRCCGEHLMELSFQWLNGNLVVIISHPNLFISNNIHKTP
jgi:hypothetical protein